MFRVGSRPENQPRSGPPAAEPCPRDRPCHALPGQRPVAGLVMSGMPIRPRVREATQASMRALRRSSRGAGTRTLK
jgi:hypothetical protein